MSYSNTEPQVHEFFRRSLHFDSTLNDLLNSYEIMNIEDYITKI